MDLPQYRCALKRLKLTNGRRKENEKTICGSNDCKKYPVNYEEK